MYLPSWAISVFGVVFFALAGVAGWALRLAGQALQSDLVKVETALSGVASKKQVDKVCDKVDALDKRLVRVETLLNGSMYTPPMGVPMLPPD